MRKNTWQNLIATAPQMPISYVRSRSIVYLDTKDDHPIAGHPDHKFRPMLLINGEQDITKLDFCDQLKLSLGSEVNYAVFLIPLTTQHHPDVQPLHLNHIEFPWNLIQPNLQQSKSSYLDPNAIFALSENELFDLEKSEPSMQNVPVLGRIDDQTYDQLISQVYEKSLQMEQVIHPDLKRKNITQRINWYEKHYSGGGENPLVASYKQQHPTTHRFQRPALNQPPIKEPDDGPDL